MFSITFTLALALFNGSSQISNLIFNSSAVPLQDVATAPTISSTDPTYPNCTIKWSDPLPSWYPLVFNGSGFIYPRRSNNNSDWGIVVRQNSNFKLGCPSDSKRSNNVKGYEGRSEIVVRCVRAGLTVDSKAVNFSELGCTNQVKENLVIRDGTCYDESALVDIQFQSNSTSLPLINICHDTNTDDTHYAHHYIIGSGYFEVSNNRPSFKEDKFYTKISANDAYTQNSQRNQVGLLVGSQELAEKYINTSKSFYFARGHLAPDGDFLHVYQQNATYYYINVMPQWQAINNGNWKSLETAVRNYAKNGNVDLEIWTGGKDVLKLDDVNGNPVEIYLARDSTGKLRLPAPEITWKVIKDPVREASVAVLMVNNPHLGDIPSGLKICPDVSSQITWASWDFKNIEKGFTYFCEINTVKNVLPLSEAAREELSNLKLMT